MKALDLLGIGSKNWNMKETLAAFPQGFALGFFGDNTFGGKVKQNVKALVDSGKVAAIRNQMHWDYGHKIIPMRKLEEALPYWNNFAIRYPHIPIFLSHSCEFREDNRQEIEKRLDAVLRLAPQCIPVQTPMRSWVVPGHIVEVHGQQAGKAGQICSTDGEALFNMDATKWNLGSAQAIMRFVWGERCNMAEAHNTLRPEDRTAYPTRQYLTSLVRLLEPKLGPPPVPVFKDKVIELAGRRLWKSHGEDLPADGSRDNKPLIIIPERAPFVQLVTWEGEPIGKLGYFGGYPGNMHRYYSGWSPGVNLYGYQIADKAEAKSGSPYIGVKVGKGYYWPIHPTYRQGYFQS